MSTVPETPLSHAERARLVLGHMREIKKLIEGFTFAGAPDPRTLTFAKSIRDEFFENTAVALEASDQLTKADRVRADECREVVEFTRVFMPIAEEFGIMHDGVLHTIALRRADVGQRALQIYHFAKALTKKMAGGASQVLIPHLEAMKRGLAKRKAPTPSAGEQPPTAQPPTAQPQKPGGANA